jgi:hypothetical protein
MDGSSSLNETYGYQTWWVFLPLQLASNFLKVIIKKEWQEWLIKYKSELQRGSGNWNELVAAYTLGVHFFFI